MNNKDACAAYFKEQPGFRRIFDAMRKKWESYGEIKGRVNLSHASEEEKEALSGLLGKKLRGESVSFALEEFASALRETRFSDTSLEELLEAYYGEKMVSSRERKLQKKEAEEKFWGKCQKLLSDMECNEALKWISDMREQQDFGYALVMSEYRRDIRQAEKDICQIAEAMRHSCSETSSGIRLALLAAEVTGNPHAFDRQTTLGGLFTAALCWRMNCPSPSNAEQWQILYEENGVLTDDLASQVIAFGLHLETERGLHPAYEAFFIEREPYVLTLGNLEKIHRAFGETKNIYIVENEMVFGELLEKVKDYPDVSLLCTSGQLRIAAYVLLDLLAKENCRFYYAGDMDPEGLGIAQRICERYLGQVSVWHMSISDYAKACSDVKLTKRSLEKLKNITYSELTDTALLIQKKGMAGYQEMLLEDMAEDLQKIFNSDM